MNVILRRLASPPMVVACLALVVALGGVSYAAGVLPANSVGQKQLKARAVTPAKLSPAVRGALKHQLGNTRTAGSASSAGQTGERRVASALSANIREDQLVSGAATGLAHPAEGEYVVSFGRDVSACAAVASPGFTGGFGNSQSIAVGSTSVGEDNLSNNQIVVEFHRREPTGEVNLVDTDFHLVVAC
jgi:hypothetical protein